LGEALGELGGEGALSFPRESAEEEDELVDTAAGAPDFFPLDIGVVSIQKGKKGRKETKEKRRGAI